MECFLQLTASMKLIDLIIIYLSCGAPFAVYYSFQSRAPLTTAILVRTLASCLFWPLAAASLVRVAFTGKEFRRYSIHYKTDARLDRVRIEIERDFLADEYVSLLFEFREVFIRYIGLQHAAAQADALPAESNLLQIAGHPNIRVAAACLTRTGSLKLIRHAERARHDFISLVEQMVGFESGSANIGRLAIEAAGLVGDTETISALDAISLNLTPEPLTNITTEVLGEKWKTMSESLTATN